MAEASRGSPSDQVSPQAAVAQRARRLLRLVPDHPQPGIVFRDIGPLLADGPAFSDLVDALAEPVDEPVDLVAGIEARGFILAAPLARHFAAGFIPLRKAGKLPGDPIRREYHLEYGAAALELQPDLCAPGTRVLLVDDVIATGGTALAAVELLRVAGTEVIGLTAILDLEHLGGADRLRSAGVRVSALLVDRS